MASTLPETVNVSRFLNRKEFSNTVEIIVNETKFVCSGVIVAQQSPVFEKLFMGGATFVLLEDFFFQGSELAIEECLTLLYGGKVLITISNIASLVRFSLIYEIKFMWDLAFDWIKENTTSSHICKIFDIANLPEVKSRKGDLMAFCLEFMKKNEEDIAQELITRLQDDKKGVVRDFVKAMLQLTNCPGYISFLVVFCGEGSSNTNFILDLSEFINYENLFSQYKELFTQLVGSMNKSMEDPFRLKQLIGIQMSVLKM